MDVDMGIFIFGKYGNSLLKFEFAHHSLESPPLHVPLLMNNCSHGYIQFSVHAKGSKSVLLCRSSLKWKKEMS